MTNKFTTQQILKMSGIPLSADQAEKQQGVGVEPLSIAAHNDSAWAPPVRKNGRRTVACI